MNVRSLDLPYVTHTRLITNLYDLPLEMRTTDSHHNAESSQNNKHGSSQFIDVTRRRFLTAGAAGVAGLGILGSATAATDEHTLTIEGFGPTTTYSFTVGDNLEKSTADGASINRSDHIIDRSAHGAVSNGKDAYTFTGDLYSFDFDRSGEINVLIDGEPAHVGNRPDHTLLIEGFGLNTPYSFSTSTYATKSDAYGASINKSDNANAYGVSGAVQSGKDAYTYDGRLQSFYFRPSGEVRVTIDGKAAHVGRRPDRKLTIVAHGEYTPYEFSVSGSIREVLQKEDGQDTLESTLVSGAVSGYGYDAYAYDGSLAALTYPDDTSPGVYSNDELVAKTN